jgi:hypothetical protein
VKLAGEDRTTYRKVYSGATFCTIPNGLPWDQARVFAVRSPTLLGEDFISVMKLKIRDKVPG